KLQFDNLLKSLPKTFFSLDSLDNVDDFQERLEGVLDVASKIEGGSGDFSSLQGQLEKLNFTQDEAKVIVGQLGFQYDNASIKAETLRQAEEGLIDTTEGFIDVALEATDASKNLFGYDNSEVSALQSHIETMQGLKLIYKDNYKESEIWKSSIETLSWTLGVEESQIEKNLGHYKTMLDLIPKLKLKYDEKGNAVGIETEELSKNEIAVWNKIKANGEEGLMYDILTGKTRDFNGELKDNTEEQEKNTDSKKDNKDATDKQAEATDKLAEKYCTLKNDMNQTNKAEYFSTIQKQLEDLDGKIEVTKDEKLGGL